MDKDEKVKNNRIALLTKAKDVYSTLGDFSKIVYQAVSFYVFIF